MATTVISITVNTPAGVSIADVVDTLSNYWGYQELINGSPNPQTRAAFVKAKLAAFARESYISAKAVQAADAARVSGAATAGLVAVD